MTALLRGLDGRIGVGRVAGISVGAHWSAVVGFWLVSWTLATVVFPRQVPGIAPAAAWGAALATAVGLFGALLAHELGHALVARREGVGVEGIVVWVFGGVTRLAGRADSPGAALRIALAGPLGTMAVAAAATLLAAGAAATGTSRLAAVALAWLAGANVVLAASNLLIPAAPLDGGRILEAVLWGRTADGPRAATIVSRAGRLVGVLLLGVGLVELARRADLDGAWLACLGGVQLGAAGAESRAARQRAVLTGVRVRDRMRPCPVAAPGWLTVEGFIERYVLRYRITAFPVQGLEGTLDGLATLAGLLALPPSARASTTVAAVARPLAEVPTAGPGESLLDVLPRLTAGHGDGYALVIEHGRLVGVLSASAIIDTLDWTAPPS